MEAKTRPPKFVNIQNLFCASDCGNDRFASIHLDMTAQVDFEWVASIDKATLAKRLEAALLECVRMVVWKKDQKGEDGQSSHAP